MSDLQNINRQEALKINRKEAIIVDTFMLSLYK